MSSFDQFTKLAMDTLAKIEDSTLAHKLRDRLDNSPEEDDGTRDVPVPETLNAPFAPRNKPEPDTPLAHPEWAAQIFGHSTNPWVGRARQLLHDRDVAHDFIDLHSEQGPALEIRLSRETRQTKGPYVYLRGHFIGGFNALNEIDRLGQLEEMIKTPEEQAQQPQRTRIVINKREGGDHIPGEQR